MQGLTRAAFVFLVVLAGWAAGGTGGTAFAVVTPDETLKNPKLEARARTIGKQLRCLVCQNQSIDDSDAPLARDLRRLVRERLRKGETDQQVIAYIHARYGDFVLLRPPVRPGTWALWYGPAALLLIALGVIGWRVSRRRPAADMPLSAVEEDRVANLLAKDDTGALRPGRQNRDGDSA